jgi:integrase
MAAERDLYNFDKAVEKELRRIRASKDISRSNKRKIIKFQEDLIADGIGYARIQKYLIELRKIGTQLNKDFEKLTADDIRKIMRKVERSSISESSKLEVKKTLKKFYKWLNNGEIPECVKWLKTTSKKNSHKLPEELLTEKEVKKLIETAWTPRDRALISVLWESGCRAGELLMLRIKHVSFEERMTRINVHGKTGPRRVPLIDSTPYLTEWLENHPLKNDPNAYLWVTLGRERKKRFLEYAALNKMIREVAKRAKVRKKVNPHNFRHSRATFLANHLTEAQMNQYLGWVPGSSMAATYVHLSGRDMDEPILKMRGLKPKEEDTVESTLAPKKCPRCALMNKATGKFCMRCGSVLDFETAVTMQEEAKDTDEKLSRLLNDEDVQKLLVKKMIDLKIK